jgi:hypothetical protein
MNAVWIENEGFNMICHEFNYVRCPFKLMAEENEEFFIKCLACNAIISIKAGGLLVFMFYLTL